MLYQALTNAPILQEGICLSFMAVPQRDDDVPRALEIGAEVTLRLGFCCPEIKHGHIAVASTDPARVVLKLGADEWTLEPAAGTEANAVPGIRSDVWRVR